MKAFVYFLFAALANAQSGALPANIHPDLTGLAYPPLARQARIMGTVKLRVSIDPVEVSVTSGHPLLAVIAKRNVENWRFDPPLNTAVLIEFVFRMTEPTYETQRMLHEERTRKFLFKVVRTQVYRDSQVCASTNQTTTEAPSYVDSTTRVVVSIQASCPQLSYGRESSP
jgi:hypothetical protein